MSCFKELEISSTNQQRYVVIDAATMAWLATTVWDGATPTDGKIFAPDFGNLYLYEYFTPSTLSSIGVTKAPGTFTVPPLPFGLPPLAPGTYDTWNISFKVPFGGGSLISNYRFYVITGSGPAGTYNLLPFPSSSPIPGSPATLIVTGPFVI